MMCPACVLAGILTSFFIFEKKEKLCGNIIWKISHPISQNVIVFEDTTQKFKKI